MEIHLIAARSDNGVIGGGNAMVWDIPEDMRWFRRRTLGEIVVMGRRTFESFGARALPRRRNIVVTRNPAYEAPGAETAESLAAALDAAAASGAARVFVIGGAQIYREAVGFADVLWLTQVHARYEGDAYFPTVPAARYRGEAFRILPAAGRSPALTFMRWTRRPGAPLSPWA